MLVWIKPEGIIASMSVIVMSCICHGANKQ